MRALNLMLALTPTLVKLTDLSPLLLVCQSGVHLYLNERSDIEPMGFDTGSIVWIDIEQLVGTPSLDQARSLGFDTILPDGLQLEAVPVIHWGRCFGLCLSDRIQDWKIVYVILVLF